MNPFPLLYPVFKRFLDLVVASVVLIISVPLLILAAAAIWAEDGRFPIYFSLRVGKAGRPFRMIKLRTMKVTSIEDRSQAHITKVGGVLRRMKLDELPQLCNVVRGSMSLVGPRPHTIEERSVYNSPALLSVRPGVTDLASLFFIDLNEVVHGPLPYTAETQEMVVTWKRRLAKAYIDHQSLLIDIKILLLTALAVFSRRSVKLMLPAFLVKLGVAHDEVIRFCDWWQKLVDHHPLPFPLSKPPFKIREGMLIE